MDKLDELLNELGTLSSQPRASVDLARLNKVKELIGEVGGQEELLRRFSASRMRVLAAPKRLNDVIILDLLFELDDGQYVIAEAKYGVSQAGRANLTPRAPGSRKPMTSLVSVSGGEIKQVPLTLKRQTEQLDARWIQDRIEEIGKHDEKLSKALQVAFDNDKIQVFETRSRVELTPGKKRAMTTQLTDHSERIREQAKVGRRFIDHERRFAIREALADLQVKGLAAEAQGLEKNLKEARKAEKAVQTEINKARRSLANLKQTPGKPLTTAQVAARARWNQTIKDLERQLEPLKQATADAEKAVTRNKEAAKLAKASRDYAKSARKAEERFKREFMARLLDEGRASGKLTEQERRLLDRRLRDKPTPMPGDEPVPSAEAKAAADAEKGTASKLTAEKGVAEKGTAEKSLVKKAEKGAAKTAKPVTAAKSAMRGGAKAADVASKGGRLSRLALKGTKMVVRAGGFVFKVVNFASPLFLLMDVVAIIDALVAWIRRDKIEDEKEWKRIANYLFGDPEVYNNRFGINYMTTMGHQIEAHVPLRMSDPSYTTGNAIFWTTLWDTNKNWPGFVYIQVDAVLERQQADREYEKHVIRYYWDELPKIGFTDKPTPNMRDEGGRTNYGPTEEVNNFTGGRGSGGGPEYSTAVARSFVKVHYTYPRPYLTPFDFILMKCRTLFADLVNFISLFDEDFALGLEMEEGAFTSFRKDTIRAYPFREPLIAFELQVCLSHIDFYISLLESHVAQQGDLKRDAPFDPYNAGRNRRLGLLRKIASPNGLSYPDRYRKPEYADYRPVRPFQEIQFRFGKMVSTRDPEVVADVQYLMKQADEIDTDATTALRHALSDASGFLFNYEGWAKPKA